MANILKGYRGNNTGSFQEISSLVGSSECDSTMGVCGPIAGDGSDLTVVNNQKDWKASYTDEERQTQFDNSETGKNWANYLNRSTTSSTTTDESRHKNKRSKPEINLPKIKFPKINLSVSGPNLRYKGSNVQAGLQRFGGKVKQAFTKKKCGINTNCPDWRK